MSPLSWFSLLVFCVLYGWTLYNIPILAVGLKHLLRKLRKGSEKKAKPSSEANLPLVSVIVPVKDEERVIGRLLDALLRLDYPEERSEIIIVEDGSKDKTLEICQKYANLRSSRIKVFHRETSNGKPSALNYALKRAEGEIIALFDADCVPNSDVLLLAAECFEDSSTFAVQGGASSINANENMLTRLISYEQAVGFRTYALGRNALNLFVSLTGSCCFLRREVVKKLGGFDENSLSEDLEISVRLTKEGYLIRYVPEIQSWQESPAKLGVLVKQRTRWMRGHMETAFKYGRLITNVNRKSLDTEVMLFGPFIQIMGLLGWFLGLIMSFLSIQVDYILSILGQTFLILMMTGLLIVGIALVYVTRPCKKTNLLWLPFVFVYWLAENFIAFYALLQIVFRRPRKWNKTMKTGAIDYDRK
jgi:cellulose synthase/poly-beta-1,6-N-acetylglucosamine synthase-like glycosyltransferase